MNIKSSGSVMRSKTRQNLNKTTCNAVVVKIGEKKGREKETGCT